MLLSAPPGYGKTVAVAGWLESRALAHAWLSLDVADNDLARFVRYLVAALRAVRPDPSIYGGTDYTAFYSASGWITYIAQLTWVAWFAIASLWMIRRREPGVSLAVSTADRAARREAGDTR